MYECFQVIQPGVHSDSYTVKWLASAALVCLTAGSRIISSCYDLVDHIATNAIIIYIAKT